MSRRKRPLFRRGLSAIANIVAPLCIRHFGHRRASALPSATGLAGRGSRPSTERFAMRRSGSTTGGAATMTSSSRLRGRSSPSPECEMPRGPVVRRSQAPTRLDDVEDAANSSLSHYQRQLQIRSQSSDDSNNNRNPPLASQPAMLDALLEDPKRILQFPPRDREAIGVASHIRRRLRGLTTNGDCRRCWLQAAHCVCDRCVPLEAEEACDGEGDRDDESGLLNVNRLFLLTHHKEVCLVVDTAKLILAAFPVTARLVVSGIGREHQPAMAEMLDAVSDAAANNGDGAANGEGGKCLVLFPTEDAKTFDEIQEDLVAAKWKGAGTANADEHTTTTGASDAGGGVDEGWDVIVVDGTWSQARKMHSKYLPQKSEGSLHHVRLGDEAVRALDRESSSEREDDRSDENVPAKGRQLRRHPIKWREIGTLEATRLLLNDMHGDGEFEEQSEAMAYYQEVGNRAARRQLGPPRTSRD